MWRVDWTHMYERKAVKSGAWGEQAPVVVPAKFMTCYIAPTRNKPGQKYCAAPINSQQDMRSAAR